MPKYKVTAPTGQAYTVDAPEGATGQDAIAYLSAQLGGVGAGAGAAISDSERYENILKRIEQERYAEGNALTQGLSRGVDIAQMGYGSFLEGVGKGLGLEGLEEYGGEVVAEQEEELAAKAPYATRLKDVREAEGVLDTAGELASFTGSALGESLPQMGTTIGGSLAGAAAGARMGAVAGIPGTVIGGIAGGLLANVPFFYGMNREAQKEAVADGTKIKLNEAADFLASIPQAIMDLGADRFLFGLGSRAGVNVEKLTRQGGLFTRGVKGAALGVTAEVPTEVGQQVIERFQAGRPIDSPEAIEEYLEVGAAAGLVGSSIRTVTNIVGGDPEAKRLADEAKAKSALGLDGGAAAAAAAPTGVSLAADEETTRLATIKAAEEELRVAKAREDALNKVINDSEATASDRHAANLEQKAAEAERVKAETTLAAAEDAQGFAQFIQQEPELQNVGQQKRRELFDEYKTVNKARASYESGDNTLQDLYTGFGIKIGKNIDGEIKLADITPEMATTIVNDFTKRSEKLVEKGAEKDRVLIRELEQLDKSDLFRTIKDKVPERDRVPLSKKDDSITAEIDRVEARRLKEAQKRKADTAAAPAATPVVATTTEQLSRLDKIPDFKPTEAFLPPSSEQRREVTEVLSGRSLQFFEEIEDRIGGGIAPRTIFAEARKKLTKKEDVAAFGVAEKAIKKLWPGARGTVAPPVVTTPVVDKAKKQLTPEEFMAQQDAAKAAADKAAADKAAADKAADAAAETVVTKPVGRTRDYEVVGDSPEAIVLNKDIEEARKAWSEVKEAVDAYIYDHGPELEKARFAEMEKVARGEATTDTALADLMAKEESARDRIKEAENASNEAARARRAAAAGTAAPEAAAAEAGAIPESLVVPAALRPRKDGKESAYDAVTKGENPLTLEDLDKETPTGANKKFTGTQLVKFWGNKKKRVKQLADRAPAVEEAAQLAGKRVAADTKAAIYDDQKIEEITNGLVYKRFIERVTKSRQAVNAKGKTDLQKGLEADASIVASNELSAAGLDEGIGTSVEDDAIDAAGRAAAQDIAREGGEPALTEEVLQQNFKEYVYRTFDPDLAGLANRAFVVGGTRSGKDTRLTGEALEQLTNAAEAFYNEVIKIAEAMLPAKVAYSIAPETVTTPTSPEVMSAILSTRMGQNINDTVTIARNPQELGLTQLEPTAKGVILDKRVYLFTDNIEAGNELGVFLHEVGSHVGMKDYVGKGNYNRLINTIKRFASKTDGSFESRLAKRAMDRLKLAEDVLDKNVLPNDELLAYFIEEAVDAGVDPVEAGKEKSPIGNIFRSIMAFFKAGWRKLFRYPYNNPTAQEVVDMAYGAAGLVIRNPTAMLSNIDKQLLYSIATTAGNEFVETQSKINVNTQDRDFLATINDIGLTGLGKTTLERATNYKKHVYNFMGLLQLADQVSKKYPELAGVIRKIEAIVNTRKQIIDDKRREVEDFSLHLDTVLNSKEYKPYREAFEDVVHDSTIDEIDLRNNTDRTDPNRVVRNTDLYKRFAQLPAPLQEVYIRLSNKYENFATEYIATLEKFLGEAGIADAHKNMLDLLKGQITPYFPLLRHNGNYWLDFRVTNLRDASGALTMDDTGAAFVKRVTLSYESPEQRLAAKQILEKDPDVIKGSILTYARPNDASISSEVPNPEIEKLLGALTGDADLPASTKKLIVDNYLNMFPDSSLKKQFKKRKKIAGFRKDSVRNFAQIGHQMANQLASMQQSKELRDAYAALDEIQRTSAEPEGYIRSDDDSGATKADPNVAQIIQSVKDKREFLENPQPKSWAATLSWGSYVWYILGNLSSAFVNLSQIAIGYFHMVGRYGLVDTHKAFMNAMKMYMNGGRDNNTKFEIPKALGFLTGFNTSLADKTFGANKNLSPEYRALYDAGLARGAVRRTTGQELVDMQKGRTGKLSQRVHKYTYALSWYFQNTERANREIALIAAYDLARKKGTAEIRAGSSEYGAEKGATDKKSAINFAVDFVDTINGPAIAETGPTHFQDGIGKVMGTFKRFAFSQVYLQYRLARDAVSHVDPKERGIAFKQIAAIMVPAYTLAGMKGLPFYGAVDAIASMAMSDFLLGDEDEPWEFDTSLNAKMGDFAFFGLFNAVLGTDLASRTGFGNMLFPHDNPYKREQLEWLYYPLAFAGPAVGIVGSLYDGIELFSEGQLLRGMEKITPSFMNNPLQAARFSDLPMLGEGGALTRDGMTPIMDPVPTGSILMNMFGFSPAELTKRYRANSSAKQYQRAVLERRRGLLNKLYGAKVTGDYKEEGKVRKEIARFNNSRFGRAMPINASSEIKSFKAKLKRSEEYINGLYINEKLRDPILEDVGIELS